MKQAEISTGSNTSARPWVLFELRRQTFALPAEAVHELVMTPQVTGVPGVAAYISGVMNLRGRVLPVVDLRERLGMPSRAAEAEAFCGLMDQRQQDHVRWLSELEACAQDDRKFQLATDPHLCAFGKWYYSYQPPDAWIAGLLKRFEAPHTQIHATAAEALELAQNGHRQDALKLIARRRSTVLAQMIELFGKLREMVRDSHRDTVMVLEGEGGQFAVSIDLALCLERFDAQDLEDSPVAAQAVVEKIARKGKDGSPVMLLDAGRLLRG